MKNIKTKIILSAIIFLSVAGFIGTANATTASLYVSPASLTKITGNIFSVSMGFNASGNKVCASEGTIVFNNLTCQSITVASDVMAQSLPTCSNPHFLIGIPNCTTLDKVLLTVSVKAGSAGTASISLTGVDIIGEGVSVGSASISGSYTISAVLAPAPAPASTPKPTSTIKPIIKSTPTSVSTSTLIPTSTQEITTSQQEEDTSTMPIVSVTPEVKVEQVSLLASIGDTLSFGTGRMLLVTIIILMVLIFVILYFVRKNPRKKINKK